MPLRTAKKSKRLAMKRKKGFSYRKFSLVKKTNDLLKKLFAVLLLFLLAGIGALSFYLYHSFRNPFAQAAGSLPKETRWDGKTPINLALIKISDLSDDSSTISDLLVLHIDPEGERYALTSINPNQQVSMPFGFGENSLNQAYAVGNTAEPKLNTALTCRLLESSAKIPIDGYFLTDSVGWGRLSELSGEIDPTDLGRSFSLSLIFKVKSLISILPESVRTDLSLPEIYYVLSGLSKSRSAMSKFCESGAECLPEFMDSTILSADKKIVVLNGTGKPGLANFCAQIIKNIGGRVVFVSNTKEEYAKTTLLTDSFEDYTSLRVQKVFGVSEAFHKDDYFDKEDFIDRGDIILIVGLDKMGFWW